MCGEVDGGNWVDENSRVGGEMGLPRSGLAQKITLLNVIFDPPVTRMTLLIEIIDN